MANQPKKYKKFVATAATATLVASAIVPVASAASFSDVPANSEFAPYIDALTEAGIINGYTESNTFKPGAALTRGQVVKMLGRWVENNGVEVPADWNTKARFKDVPTNHKDQELVKYAALVADEGVFGGADGKLMAGNNITRQQMAKVLNGAYAAVNGESLVEIAEGVDAVEIPDLDKARAEYEEAIQALMDLGISSTKSNNFRPLENVTRAQFSKFLFNTIELDPAMVSPFEVKAINNTTVEVTFDEEIADIKALDFKIEGLEVTNAVVKQTDKKTAVLTTAAQKAGTEYTVTEGGNKLGTFTGMSAVVPTAVKVSSNSQQGVVGKEVTVSATVTVAEGDSKAGVPVTFNINAGNRTFNKDHVVEVKTNADGVASYSYTQYAGGEDLVTAYATGNANIRSTSGKVYWGVKERLTVTEVTEADVLANGSKKVYKIKATTESGGNASGFVNIAFAENVDVTPDKGVKKATITDASFYGTTDANGVNRSSSVKYPYQYTNGNENGVRVALKNGEATFTVSGTDASVTPIVFIDGSAPTSTTWTGDDVLGSTELQAKAETVKFENVQSVEVSVESVGTADAAAKNLPGAPGEGGRDYKVTVKDKDGKLAPKGTKVWVTITEDDLEGNVYLQRTAAKGGNFKFTGAVTNRVAIETDKDGVAKFTLIGDKNDYGTPTVYIENGSKANELDASDAQAKGEIVYFGDAVVNSADLTVVDGNGEEITSLNTGNVATFVYQVVDQNGKAHKATSHNATFEVYNGGYNTITAGGVSVAPFKTASVPLSANGNGKATLNVTASDVSSVTVNVSGSQYTLGNKTATVDFINSSVLSEGIPYVGTVKSVNKVNKTFVFTVGGFEHTLNYSGGKHFLEGESRSENAFEALLSQGDSITYIKGAVQSSFDITEDVTLDVSALTTAIANAKALVNTATTADYAQADIDAYNAAIAAAEAAKPLTSADVTNAVNTLGAATTAFNNAKIAALAITASEAIDSDLDGTIDQVKFTFNRAVNDATIEAADFRFYKGAASTFDSGASVVTGTANDNVVTITFAPTATITNGSDLEYAYSSTFSGTLSISDLNGSVLPAKVKSAVSNAVVIAANGEIAAAKAAIGTTHEFANTADLTTDNAVALKTALDTKVNNADIALNVTKVTDTSYTVVISHVDGGTAQTITVTVSKAA